MQVRTRCALGEGGVAVGVGVGGEQGGVVVLRELVDVGAGDAEADVAVPVTMRSPASRRRYWLRRCTICGTVKIMSAVVPSCLGSPLTDSISRSVETSPISSGVASHGPSGNEVGKDLLGSHCPPPSSCSARSETSLAATCPPTTPAASSTEASSNAVRR